MGEAWGGNAPPYAGSQVISEMVLDWSSHKRLASGSDNWPVTWADDDHQYTAWGDGGGFGGTNKDGRLSLGVARIEGEGRSYRGFNVWGGKNQENPATFDGKSYGILYLEGALYMWVSPGSGARNYNEARLYKSADRGRSWTVAAWAFLKEDGMILPTFLQFGKAYQGARDDFVYIYANHWKKQGRPGTRDTLRVQKPGEIALMRVPQKNIMDRSAYQFFAGLDADGNPIWTSDLASRKAAFMDANGVGWNVSVSYNPGIARYLLTTEHTETNKGNLGTFDGPEPWGPWTTVAYISRFGFPWVEPTTFFWNFSNKWLSKDGKEFVLVFTGTRSNDSWNTVKGSFVVSRRSAGHGTGRKRGAYASLEGLGFQQGRSGIPTSGGSVLLRQRSCAMAAW